jgi:hypothetical protein
MSTKGLGHLLFLGLSGKVARITKGQKSRHPEPEAKDLRSLAQERKA